MKIPGGYFIIARRVAESSISHAPPHFREVWFWLLKEANHVDRKVGGKIIKRGQCLRSYTDIIEGLSWRVGYRKEGYKKHHIQKAMKWLMKEQMVATTKVTRGMIITILNYDKYQEPQNYESYSGSYKKATMEIHDKQECKEYIYKNILGEKPDTPPEPVKKKTNKIFIKPTVDEIKQYCQERKNGIDPQRFFDFNEAKGWMIGKNKMKDWRAAVRTWENNKKGNGASEEKKEYTPPPKKCGTCYHFFRVDKYSGEKTCFDKNPEEKTCYKYTLDPCAISRKFINNQVNP